MGVARLMDLLGSDHEVLRNEALLLLVGLTRASTEVQKIAAFEGAFERVLSIARCVLRLRWAHRHCTALQRHVDAAPEPCREEGGAEGGIVVQDCLELLNNLLRTNAGNQLMFRCAGLPPRRPEFLQANSERLTRVRLCQGYWACECPGGAAACRAAALGAPPWDGAPGSRQPARCAGDRTPAAGAAQRPSGALHGRGEPLTGIAGRQHVPCCATR